MNSVPVITYLLKQIVHDMYDIIFLTIIESNTKKTSANRNYVLMISTISTLKQSLDNQKPLDGKAMNSKDFKVHISETSRWKSDEFEGFQSSIMLSCTIAGIGLYSIVHYIFIYICITCTHTCNIRDTRIGYCCL